MVFKTKEIKSILPYLDIQLTHSKKKFNWFLKRMGDMQNPIAIADEIMGDKGETFYVVAMKRDLDSSWLADVDILSHEASHIVDFYLERIGERDAKGELRAYLQGAITRRLCREHFRWKEKKLKKKSKKNKR